MQVIPASKYLTREERIQFSKKSNWLAIQGIIFHYLWITAGFLLVYFFPNPLSIFISLWILGGKQLACAILMHDTSHHAVFNSKKPNDWVGEWLGGYPIFNSMKGYRPYHYRHHVSNGLEDDPDLLLTRAYPATRKSLFRKFFRDLSGQTGIKALFGLILMHLGFIEFNLGGKVVKVSQKGRKLSDYWQSFRQNLLGPLVANAVIFILLATFLSPWLYLLWIGAYLTTFQFCLRVRSIAEHSVVKDRTDPYQNTRTTQANWLEQLLFAPYHVNYHCEHHMLMSVPPYRLPAMHKALKRSNFYQKGLLAPGYWYVLKNAVKQT